MFLGLDTTFIFNDRFVFTNHFFHAIFRKILKREEEDKGDEKKNKEYAETKEKRDEDKRRGGGISDRFRVNQTKSQTGNFETHGLHDNQSNLGNCSYHGNNCHQNCYPWLPFWLSFPTMLIIKKFRVTNFE